MIRKARRRLAACGRPSRRKSNWCDEKEKWREYSLSSLPVFFIYICIHIEWHFLVLFSFSAKIIIHLTWGNVQQDWDEFQAEIARELEGQAKEAATIAEEEAKEKIEADEFEHLYGFLVSLATFEFSNFQIPYDYQTYTNFFSIFSSSPFAAYGSLTWVP